MKGLPLGRWVRFGDSSIPRRVVWVTGGKERGRHFTVHRTQHRGWNQFRGYDLHRKYRVLGELPIGVLRLLTSNSFAFIPQNMHHTRASPSGRSSHSSLGSLGCPWLGIHHRPHSSQPTPTQSTRPLTPNRHLAPTSGVHPKHALSLTVSRQPSYLLITQSIHAVLMPSITHTLSLIQHLSCQACNVRCRPTSCQTTRAPSTASRR
jgi:hypothetical protein